MNHHRHIIKTVAFFAMIGLIISCSLSSEEIATDPSFKLQFSADTVFFDTIISEIPSITKRLRVYNSNNSAVSIASIKLIDNNSPYQLTINGMTGLEFQATKVLANDSLLVLIEAKIGDQNELLPYVVEDKLEFSTNGNIQNVALVSWGQDAHFLRDSILVCNTTWTAGKPYVIYDNILVDSLCSLKMLPGTRVYSHFGSQLYIKGTLTIEGRPDSMVVLTNDRFDGDYQQYPGQWSGITFLPGSKNNHLSSLHLRNADYGIWLGTPDEDADPDLVIENSIIENMSRSAVIAFTSDLTLNNTLIYESGDVLFAGLAGGNYILNHNTIANYGYNNFKSQPTFYVSDKLELSDGSEIEGAVYLELNNNIVWGSSGDELLLTNETEKQFELLMNNNLLRSTNVIFDGFNNILNQDPRFIDPPIGNFQLGEGSPAIKAGLPIGFAIDLVGNPRLNPPDIGAFERQ